MDRSMSERDGVFQPDLHLPDEPDVTWFSEAADSQQQDTTQHFNSGTHDNTTLRIGISGFSRNPEQFEDYFAGNVVPFPTTAPQAPAPAQYSAIPPQYQNFGYPAFRSPAPPPYTPHAGLVGYPGAFHSQVSDTEPVAQSLYKRQQQVLQHNPVIANDTRAWPSQPAQRPVTGNSIYSPYVSLILPRGNYTPFVPMSDNYSRSFYGSGDPINRLPPGHPCPPRHGYAPGPAQPQYTPLPCSSYVSPLQPAFRGVGIRDPSLLPPIHIWPTHNLARSRAPARSQHDDPSAYQLPAHDQPLLQQYGSPVQGQSPIQHQPALQYQSPSPSQSSVQDAQEVVATTAQESPEPRPMHGLIANDLETPTEEILTKQANFNARSIKFKEQRAVAKEKRAIRLEARAAARAAKAALHSTPQNIATPQATPRRRKRYIPSSPAVQASPSQSESSGVISPPTILQPIKDWDASPQRIVFNHCDYNWTIQSYELTPKTTATYGYAEAWLHDLLKNHVKPERIATHTTSGFIKDGTRTTLVVMHNAANPFVREPFPTETTTIGVYGKHWYAHEEVNWTTITPSISATIDSCLLEDWLSVKTIWSPNMIATERRFHRAYWLAANRLSLGNLLNRSASTEVSDNVIADELVSDDGFEIEISDLCCEWGDVTLEEAQEAWNEILEQNGKLGELFKFEHMPTSHSEGEDYGFFVL